MLQQPTAEWVPNWQSSSGSLLNAQPHCAEEPANGPDADFGTATSLAVVLLTVLHADNLKCLYIALKDLERSRHQGDERSLLVALEDYSRMAKPSDILDGQVHHELVLVISFAWYYVAEDVLACVAPDDQAEDDVAALAGRRHLCVAHGHL